MHKIPAQVSSGLSTVCIVIQSFHSPLLEVHSVGEAPSLLTLIDALMNAFWVI